MAPFGGNAEAIALAIETRADPTGIRQARTELAALKSDATKATASVAQQAEAATVATAKQAAATQQAAAAQVAATSTVTKSTVAASTATASAAKEAAASQTVVTEAVKKTAAATKVATTENATSAATYDRVNPKIKSAATSFALISQAAITGQGSMAGLANAGALAAESLASVSKSAKIASLASGIGAAVVALTVVVALYRKMGERAREVEQNDYNRMLHNARTVDSQRQIVASMELQRKELLAQGGIMLAINNFLEKIHIGWGELHKLNERIFAVGEQIKDTQVAEAREAKDRARTLRESFATQTQSLKLETTLADMRAKSRDSLARQTFLQKLSVDAQLVDTEREINQRYEIRNADGNIVALTREQVRQRETLIAQARASAEAAKGQADAEAAITREEANRAAAHRIAGNDAGGQSLEDRVREINEEKDARIRAGEDVALAETEAQQEIGKARHDQTAAAVGLYGKMSNAAKLHGSVVAQVASVAAKAIALYEIIPKAKSDAQKGKSEFAAALADFAVPGKQAFGAAHLLASGAYFSSAAFGFAEAAGLGGSGGSAGGSSGGSGGGASAGTFEPVDKTSQGGQTLILQTVNPHSREVIGEAIYEIDRSNKLNRPILLPPTRGLAMAGA